MQHLPDSIDLVWSEGIRSIEAQVTEASELDRKTSPLVGLVAAGIAVLIAQRPALGAAFGLFLAALGAVLAYLLLGLRLRKFGRAPALPVLMEWANTRERDVKIQFLGNLLEAHDQNARTLAAKELYLTWAVNAMLVLLLLTPFAILLFGGNPDVN